jgi:hypothetical protein
MTNEQKQKWVRRTGYVVSGAFVLMMLMSATMKLTGNAEIVEMMTTKFGFSKDSIFTIGVLELCCVCLYAVPRTTVFGAVMFTGYLGAAIAAHLRVADPFTTPLVLGGVAWLGVFLRDERVRTLLPLRHATG